MNAEPSPADQAMVHRLLEAARAQPTAPPSDAEVHAPEFDWTHPSRYQADQMTRLARFGQDLARTLSDGLADLLRQELTLEMRPVQLHYGQTFREAFEGGTQYVAPLVLADRSPAGALLLPAALAGEWVGRLLGGNESVGDRELSALEKDLLLDLVRAAAEGISAGLAAGGGQAVQSGERIVAEREALPGDQAGELCEFAYEFPGEPPTPAMACVLACDLLDPAVGAGAASRLSPDETRRRLQAHLARVPVRLALNLGRARLSLREVMDLDAGDVVVLDARADQPGRLLISHKPALQANPVQCKHRCAAQVVRWLPAAGEAETDPTT